MRFLVMLLVIAGIGFGAWQWIDGMSNTEKIRGFMQDALEDGKGKDEQAFKQTIVARAKNIGVDLKPEDIRVTITDGGGSLLTGTVNNEGLKSSSRTVKISIPYRYKVLGLSLTPAIEDGRTYTSTQMIMNPAYQSLGQ